ncbi:MAG: SEL1-like repeat protein, partial [Rhodobacteraceae bacterium]|nr:SEL1-like repeat protein [Paracoccaceae bacterium]
DAARAAAEAEAESAQIAALDAAREEARAAAERARIEAARADIPETECDRAAGFPWRPRQPGLATREFSDIDAAAAIRACTNALRAHPEEPFFGLLLARAYNAADPQDPRIETLTRAALAVHPALARERLALLHRQGSAGLRKDEARARRLNEEACRMEDGIDSVDACAALAAMQRGGEGGATDPVAALRLDRDACTAGSARGCRQAGLAMRDGTGAVADDRLALGFFRRACELGDANGCAQHGWHLENGRGAAANATVAARSYELSCDRGDAWGCLRLGMLHREGKGVAQDNRRALALYERACDRGSGAGCQFAGRMYEQGDGIAQDHRAALRVYRQGCEGGTAAACFDEGRMHEAGHGTARDMTAALRLYERSCEGEFAEGCGVAGWFHRQGTGTRADDRRAVDFYRSACDGDHALSCARLAFMAISGLGMNRDPSAALAAARRACDGDNGLGCRNLGVLTRDGEGTRPDPVAALAALRKGCDLGDRVACDEAAKLEAAPRTGGLYAGDGPPFLPGQCGIVLASRRTMPEVASYIATLPRDQLDEVRVFLSSNGWHAIVHRVVSDDVAPTQIASAVRGALYPDDAFCSRGTSFQREIAWRGVAPGSPILQVAPNRNGYLNLREGPGTQHPIVQEMDIGTRVEVLGSQGSWRRVRLATGVEGWASANFMEPAAR